MCFDLPQAKPSAELCDSKLRLLRGRLAAGPRVEAAHQRAIDFRRHLTHVAVSIDVQRDTSLVVAGGAVIRATVTRVRASGPGVVRDRQFDGRSSCKP